MCLILSELLVRWDCNDIYASLLITLYYLSKKKVVCINVFNIFFLVTYIIKII